MRDRFSKKSIKEFYFKYIIYNSAPGIDKINKRLFDKKLQFHIETISNKVLLDTYSFTPYREMLVLKSRDKCPRQISIPTIRDKVTLGIAKNILQEKFADEIKHKLVQQLIEDIKKSIPNCDYIIKLDIQDFFPTVDHQILFTQLRKYIKSPKLLSLIRKAIQTPTVPEKGEHKDASLSSIGIPQGLPISNILSSIYLLDIDKKYGSRSELKYYRFVDDILILCKATDKDSIQKEIIEDIKALNLALNPDKIESHLSCEEFAYLGYCFRGNTITVREKTIKKLEISLESLFTEYKNSGFKRTNFFVWKLNQKISGCFNKGEKYGWVFFFSQITDEKVLYHLDWVVDKLIKRFNLEKRLRGKKIKRFVRTYWEVLKNLSGTNYIPNYDKFSLSDKEKFLKDMEIEMQIWDEDHIDRMFYQVIFSSIRGLERDIQNLRERY